MKKGTIFLAGLVSLAQSDPRFLQLNTFSQYQIIPSDPYYISPFSQFQTFQPAKDTFDPYIPTSSKSSSSTDQGWASSNAKAGEDYSVFRYQSSVPANNGVQTNNQLRSSTYSPNYPNYSSPNSQSPLTSGSNVGFNFGSSSGSSDGQNLNNNSCGYPRSMIGGVCRCPNDGIYLAGRCIGREQPSKNCNAPRTIINGECICPNNQIYTSQNKCISNQASNDQTQNVGVNQCKPPRIKTLNGYCICPNNRIYISGECYSKDPTYSIGSQPIYSSKDVNSIASLGRYFREFDGTNNNVYNPSWGSKGSILERRCPAFYDDQKDLPHGYLPNPRHLSNKLADVGLQDVPRSRNKVTMAFTAFGQFVDHDLDLTQSGQDQRMDISIPYGDKFFKTQTKMGFVRSGYQKGNAVRMHRNMITSWIDGNQIYGSDLETSNSLRSFVNGKLKTSSDNLLPRQPTFGLFLAGDVRANENVMLTAYHVVFLRQHNRICDQIKYNNPQMNEEAIFRSARQWVVGLLQKIVMEQFVPILMGDQYDRIIGKYSSYKSYINPNIPTQFATAAFRVGHSLIIDYFTFVNKNGVHYQNVKLRDLFLNAKFVTTDKIDDALRGLSSNLSKQKSIKITDQVRNLLILAPNDKQTKLDLFSLNLQRGRDHGLPSYNQARAAYGMKKVSRFEQIQSDLIKAENLKNAYNNKIDDVELFIGIISEQPVRNGVLGELGCQIVGQAFRNLRDGDRFWYEGSYPQQVVSKIKKTTLADVIRRNTNIGFQMQNDVFHYYQ